jgi:hypothetical protein
MGANGMAYLPNADDIGQVLGCAVLPCKAGGGVTPTTRL